MGNTIYIESTVEIDIDDYAEDLSDDILIEQLSIRGLTPNIALSFDEWKIIEALCSKKSIVEADKIKSFFKQQ